MNYIPVIKLRQESI